MAIKEIKVHIEMSLKNFNEVRENEDGTGEIVTDDIVGEIAEALKSDDIKERIQEVLSEHMTENVPVEGFESIDDYGAVVTTIKVGVVNDG